MFWLRLGRKAGFYQFFGFIYNVHYCNRRIRKNFWKMKQSVFSSPDISDKQVTYFIVCETTFASRNLQYILPHFVCIRPGPCFLNIPCMCRKEHYHLQVF